jgi:hypothetical protein
MNQDSEPSEKVDTALREKGLTPDRANPSDYTDYAGRKIAQTDGDWIKEGNGVWYRP